MSKKYFGTDGIRGRVGQSPITPDFMMRLGWAAGKVFSGIKGGKVVIGKDTRISGYMFESALEAGLSAAGVDSLLLGPMPTPAIAHLTRTLHADAGIVISASHNPYFDNGIKFFSSQGTKLPDEVEHQIEAMLDQPMRTNDSSELGKAVRIHDAEGRYIEFCKSAVTYSTTLKDLRIVVDCANGATYKVAPSVFHELGAEVIPLGVDPDGLNINEDCGSTSPNSLRNAVLDTRADLGIALDGDGDRLIMVDHLGNVLDGDELLYIITHDRVRRSVMQGGVVGTLMTNLGFEHALERLNVPFVRAKVGDRYVMEQLVANDWFIGGESSGHIICLDRTTTGDGIVSALQVLAAVVDTGRTLNDLASGTGMTKYPQILLNVEISEQIDVDQSETIQSAVRDAESNLADSGRVLLRPSGTEPVIRVMVEGQDSGQVQQVAEELADVVRSAVNE
ncbi:Phosphoglucosamine mutase [hydrothermal vent metagenome]|uniref:Phosphoglucosamine mutase n=1 Tax=hydrothermal vent metagenome TaxID=652676 RepID=A0A3B1A150_9ZZZZ